MTIGVSGIEYYAMRQRSLETFCNGSIQKAKQADKNDMQQPARHMLDPYTLSIKDAANYFGISPYTIYNWISIGRLHRGPHYLKIGWKVLIKRDAFIEFLEKEDGTIMMGAYSTPPK